MGYRTTQGGCCLYKVQGEKMTCRGGAVSIYNMSLDGHLIRVLRLRWTSRHSLGGFIP